MKTLLILALMAMGAVSARATGNDTSIYGVGASSAPVISTYVWTNATPTANQIEDQTGIMLSNPATNTASMGGLIGSCSTVPTESTTTYRGPIELPKGTMLEIEIRQGLCVYMLSRHTQSEPLNSQAVKRKKN